MSINNHQPSFPLTGTLSSSASTSFNDQSLSNSFFSTWTTTESSSKPMKSNFNHRNYHILPSMQHTCKISVPRSSFQHQHTSRRKPLQARNLASKRHGNKKNYDGREPLLNEHLIAKLLTGHVAGKGGQKAVGSNPVSAETLQVRLVLDLGRKANDNSDDSDGDGSDSDGEKNDSSGPTSQVLSLMEAMDTAHKHNLDLMEVALKQNPPVIKAVDFEKWKYDMKKKERNSNKGGGGISGAIGDKSVKEFKFRAGIADHDLERKTKELIKYLSKGHAIRVTLTARRYSLNEDSAAINTTLERVKELLGDRAVEVRGSMKGNDKGNFGTLLLHPNKNSKK